VSDDNDDNQIESANKSTDKQSIDIQKEEWCKPVGTNFDLYFKLSNGSNEPNIIEHEEDHQPTSAAAELLRFHHKFGNVSFRKLQQMAKMGTIPKRLAKCQIPTCSACLYANGEADRQTIKKKQW
jgi:hypothetical protein